MVESDARDLSVGHRKTFFFVRRKEKFALEVSLDKTFPDDWQYHSKKPLLRKVPYEQISSFSRHSLIYTLKKETSMDGNLLCVFTVSQEKGQISVQLAAHLKLIENNLPAGHTPSGPNFWEQSGASMKVEMTVTKAGETLTISDSGVKLEVPPNAIPTHMEQCRIQMKITPSRVVEDQVTSFCSNSCTAVEISPCNLSLHCPARLTLPHCLTFKKKKDCKARIFINEEEGSPSPWLEKQDLEYELNDSVCIMHLEKLCCVKYSIDDDGVKAKRIILYTAAKSLKQNDALAEVEVGYYSDIPGGRELLQLNPKLEVDSETELLFMEKQKLALELLLDCVIPLQWKCRMPNENPQEIPYKVIASSIEHSHLYVLQKENDQPGSVICQFIASQKDSPLSSEISLRLYPQEDHHEGIAQNHQMKPNTYSMTDTFQLLAKKLTDEWKSLGRKLHLDDADIYRIETDCKSTEEAIYQMLQCWKKKEGSSATYAVLVTALEEVNRKDLAEKVQNLKDVFEEA
ncbi:THO complex subunit 1 [Holothuria leucospilota]|uniref:THO complex subunit 1 n=1 Tax=Holothuria leucospilota TaxID=206669 RepID=A0A9Q1H638_HOLLE|nr:THO complex subunit 1 [Holothuria leucospilota]